MSDAEGAARASGAMTQDSFVKIEELLRKETAGQYTIEKMVGKGGMALVYLARELHLARNVAIKVLPPELTFGHGVERFKREAKTAAALDHPNIIPVYRVSTEGTLFWYAMKYLEGQSLEQVLKDRGKLALHLAIKILRQVADALDYAHERKVVHRDMKPANVMLDTRNRVIVTDFGIAKALSEGTLTASGSVIGTPYFMSPEQGMGKMVSGASDQYSVGVMAYRMLAGHVPFEGDSAIDVLHKHCMVQPPPLENAAPGMPRHVYLAVHRALDKKAEHRFPTVGAFVDALESADALGASAAAVSLGGTGAGDATLVVPTQGFSNADLATTPMPSLARSAPGLGDPTIATPPPQTVPPRTALRIVKKKRSPVGFIVAGLIVVGGGGAGVFVATRDRPAPDPVVLAPVESPTEAPGPAQQTPAPTRDTAAQSSPTQPPVESRPTQPIPAAPTTGTLIIQGMPAGGTVTVGGRVQSGTQLELPPGRHQVRIVHPNYEVQSQLVTVQAGQLATVRFDARLITQQQAPVTQPPAQQPQPTTPTRPAGLLEGQGILRLSVNVAAEVYVQGTLKGRGRVIDTLLAGTYEIKIVGPSGYRDTTFFQQVNAGPDGTLVRVELKRQ
ncbi:MAG TPA: protein kinase [Gemmatimonadales bacterium]